MKIKFYLYPYETPERSHYQHLVVALAQGFQEIGVEFFANIDYWYELEKKEYLIQSAPSDFTANVHVYSTSFIRNFPIENHSLDSRATNIYLDNSDAIFTEIHDPNFTSFDLILRVHYNKNIPYSSHVIPWAFGLTQQMISAVDQTRREVKNYEILNNLRNGHSLRDYLVKELCHYRKYKIDHIQTFSLSEQETIKHHPLSYWSQTGRRYDLRYYQFLHESIFTYSFGGYVLPQIIEPNFSSVFFRKSIKMRIRLNNMFNFRLFRPLYISQFDNFRFWDTLYANTTPIHVDLENYGCKLPVMPKNWQHYIGIENIHLLSQFTEKLESLSPSKLESITEEGKQWVISHYSPVAVANRFLNLLL